jgi:hypothetical protein
MPNYTNPLNVPIFLANGKTINPGESGEINETEAAAIEAETGAQLLTEAPLSNLSKVVEKVKETKSEDDESEDEVSKEN